MKSKKAQVQPPIEQKKSKAWIWILIILILVVGVVIVWFLVGGGGETGGLFGSKIPQPPALPE